MFLARTRPIQNESIQPGQLPPFDLFFAGGTVKLVI
jgi:hypothetical protein